MCLHGETVHAPRLPPELGASVFLASQLADNLLAEFQSKYPVEERIWKYKRRKIDDVQNVGETRQMWETAGSEIARGREAERPRSRCAPAGVNSEEESSSGSAGLEGQQDQEGLGAGAAAAELIDTKTDSRCIRERWGEGGRWLKNATGGESGRSQRTHVRANEYNEPLTPTLRALRETQAAPLNPSYKKFTKLVRSDPGSAL